MSDFFSMPIERGPPRYHVRMAAEKSLLPIARIERRILLLRGQHVMLDADLAELYDVPTKALNQAVKRNRARFPGDFMFQLTWAETRELSRSQIVTLKRGLNPKYRPYAFTETESRCFRPCSEARNRSRSTLPSCEPSSRFVGSSPLRSHSPVGFGSS